jgi:serine/threonine-protein kinase
VPAFGPLGQILAPEVVRGEVEASDPAAAEAIDLYGLGCVAIELARGSTAFSEEGRDLLRGHAYEPPPRLADMRPDLPAELSDLVEWLLAKKPASRPYSAKDVLAQVDAVIERLGTKNRTVRVLIVDDDTARARWSWSPSARRRLAMVEIASEGTDAAHKLNRDQSVRRRAARCDERLGLHVRARARLRARHSSSRRQHRRQGPRAVRRRQRAVPRRQRRARERDPRQDPHDRHRDAAPPQAAHDDLG